MRFTSNELRVLWYLKEHGGVMVKEPGMGSLVEVMADDLNMKGNTLRYHLKQLEQKCALLRTYRSPKSETFAAGGNVLMKVELVDPKMSLPAKPAPIPLAVVLAYENEELAERVAHEPTADEMMEALLNRVVELQEQVDRLQGIVSALSDENEELKKRGQPERKSSEHLTQKVKSVLTPEQWEKLRGK